MVGYEERSPRSYAVLTAVECHNLRKLDMSIPEELTDVLDDQGNTFFCLDCDAKKNVICKQGLLELVELPLMQSEEEIAAKWLAM